MPRDCVGALIDAFMGKLDFIICGIVIEGIVLISEPVLVPVYRNRHKARHLFAGAHFTQDIALVLGVNFVVVLAWSRCDAEELPPSRQSITDYSASVARNILELCKLR